MSIDPGDPLQTLGFETRFRGQARHHREAWGEVVFWKLYMMPPARNGKTQDVLDKLDELGLSVAELWSSCSDYIDNPNLESFRTFRSRLFDRGVATASTFPAFICPERFPMVDKQITRWAKEKGHLHGYAGTGGPDLVEVPELGANEVLDDDHWLFVKSWIDWCRFTAWKLSGLTGCAWRARDVEMAVFTAQRASDDMPLTPLARTDA